VNATKTMPPGLVTRTISASIAGQSLTCSSTLEEKHTSTVPDATGMRVALATMLPVSGGPRAAISPLSASMQNDRAPMRFSSLTKNPGPPPTSITIRWSSSVYWRS